MLPDAPTTLALDPTPKGFCFAVLQGSETLLEWGCGEVKRRAPGKCPARIGKLIARYDPALVVLEDMEHSRRGARARAFAEDIERCAREQGIAIARVSREEVQGEFASTGTTKHDIAVAVARFFPELEPRLPRKRKLWTSEDERMSIFDAVSFALTALRKSDSPN